jgi:hypothetical protein
VIVTGASNGIGRDRTGFAVKREYRDMHEEKLDRPPENSTQKHKFTPQPVMSAMLLP